MVSQKEMTWKAAIVKRKKIDGIIAKGWNDMRTPKALDGDPRLPDTWFIIPARALVPRRAPDHSCHIIRASPPVSSRPRKYQ